MQYSSLYKNAALDQITLLMGLDHAQFSAICRNKKEESISQTQGNVFEVPSTTVVTTNYRYLE